MADVVVGSVCTVERRFGFVPLGGPIDHRWQATVTRITPKRAYLSGSRNTWFALDDPTREVKPKYLDYLTNVASVSPPSSNIHAEKSSDEPR